jgi:hypothetical protein
MRIMFLIPVLLMPLSSVAAQEGVPKSARNGPVRIMEPAGGQPWNPTYAMAAPLAVRATDAVPRLPVLDVDTARTWSMTGAVVGAVVGAAVGGALGCLANRDSYGVFCGGQSDTKVVIGAVLGAGAGAWIGAVLPRRLR